MAQEIGVLNPIYALPGSYGMGRLGADAKEFINQLKANGIKIWQGLPHQMPEQECPYSTDTAFGGNIHFIDPEWLLAKRYIDTIPELPDVFTTDPTHIDYDAVYAWNRELLDQAFAHSQRRISDTSDFQQFIADNLNWLEDYAIFRAIGTHQNTFDWCKWNPPGLKQHDPAAIDAYIQEHNLQKQVDQIKFEQYLFDRNWQEIKNYANEKGVHLVGDIGIYVVHDSADVWAHQDLWQLDAEGKPIVISGFKPSGNTGPQVWGHPIYDWNNNKKGVIAWWVRRIKHVLTQVDRLRLDHFRGFIEYWAWTEDLKSGGWQDGPGQEFFDLLRASLEEADINWDRIFVEDVGELNQDITRIRESNKLVGMRMLLNGLQIALGIDLPRDSPEVTELNLLDPDLPHNVPPDTIVYPGNHDCATCRELWDRMTQNQRDIVTAYYRCVLGKRVEVNENSFHYYTIQIALLSEAETVIVSWVDLLGAGEERRMNYPGNPDPDKRSWDHRQIKDELKEPLERFAEMHRNIEDAEFIADTGLCRRSLARMKNVAEFVKKIPMEDATDFFTQLAEHIEDDEFDAVQWTSDYRTRRDAIIDPEPGSEESFT